jgi:hypothetical protein
MNAEELTAALDGRWNGRSGLARCPAHNDRNPSLSIAEKGDRTVFVCRSGCSQREVIEALRPRELWSSPHERSPRTPAPFRWEDSLRANAPEMPPCCLRGPEHGEPSCKHWREFEREYERAHARGYLTEATIEVIELYRAAKYPLDGETIRRELNVAAACAGRPIAATDVIDAVIDSLE